MVPNFLIVGVMKAGTTTLAYYLNQHPDVFLPDREIHFFDNDKNYARGIQWYEGHFVQACAEQIVGEKTPTTPTSPSFLNESPEICQRRNCFGFFEILLTGRIQTIGTR